MNNLITLLEAVTMTTLYRAQKDNILAPGFQGKNILAISETFDKDAFQAVLDQQGCESIRIYYGMNDDLSIHSIIVGVDANNEDLLPQSSDATPKNLETNEGTDDPPIVEVGLRCPPHCPPPSALNP